jgi:hypothetical protein
MNWFTRPLYNPIELTLWMVFASLTTQCGIYSANHVAVEAKP